MIGGMGVHANLGPAKNGLRLGRRPRFVAVRRLIVAPLDRAVILQSA